MKYILRAVIALFLLTVMQLNFGQETIACGPSYLTPVFDYTYAPERPWTDFASGKLGIVKPTYRRIVLFAAYRYLNNNGLGSGEQKGVIEAWEAQFNRIEPQSKDIKKAVDEWVEARKSVADPEQPTPKIYTDRQAEDYSSFQNCSRNSFEVATQTLQNRATSYGSDSKDVREWLTGQDAVFARCGEGSDNPPDLAEGAPEWLRKDRDYQQAAAAFYSGSYKDASERFTAIAADNDSPWRELADYLVARSLVRVASEGENESNFNEKNTAAEQYIDQLIGRANTYGNDARRLQNLIKYRIRPKERVRELAQKLTYQSDAEDIRQDLIDYTWLLNELESEALKKAEEEEEKRKPKPTPDANTAVNTSSVANMTIDGVDKNPDPYTRNYSGGGYYGATPLTINLLPDYLMHDPLSEWLFIYQMEGDEAYFHALRRWKETSSDIWFMTAMTKAKKNLGGLKELMDAAKFASPTSAAHQTIMYHRIRLLMEAGGVPNQDEARKLLDGLLLANSEEMPVSTRNQFIEQRLKLSLNMSELIKFSQRKPFGFAYDDDTARPLDEIIAERKSWYNPEHYEMSQIEYDQGIDKEFADKRQWADRTFFDERALDVINEYFTTAQLIELGNNTEMPAHMKRRLIIAIWTRAYLLKNEKIGLAVAEDVVRVKPNVAKEMAAYVNARTPAERNLAGLFLIAKDGEFSPYVSGGFDYEAQDEVDIWVDKRWWCEQYDVNYDNDGNESQKADYFVPPFLDQRARAAAKLERTALKKTSDAVTYLSDRIMALAQTGSVDKRLPEALYVVFQSNQWIKYGCGNSREEVRLKALQILKTRFPRSEFTTKAIAEMAESEGQ